MSSGFVLTSFGVNRRNVFGNGHNNGGSHRFDIDGFGRAPPDDAAL